MDLDRLKKLVADDDLRLKLYDEVAAITNEVITKTNEENFPVDQDWSEEEFQKRIKEFEDIISDLCSAQVLISFWGNSLHRQSVALPLMMISDYWLEKSGRSIWLALPWYNNLLLLYYTGIAAIASNRYNNLIAVTDKIINDPIRPSNKTTMLQAIIRVCGDYEKQFQLISGDANHYVPRSEYLFKRLQSKFEELLYLGSDYEFYFDRFEVIMALVYTHQTSGDSPEYARGPIGRFGYKRRNYDNPLSELIEEANRMGDDWPPLKVGLLGGSFSRFEKISTKLAERVKKLRW